VAETAGTVFQGHYAGRIQEKSGNCLSAKAGEAVNSGAYAPFILTVDWLGWLCYF